MKLYILILIILTTFHFDLKSENQKENKLVGVYSQHCFYKFSLIEFQENFTYNYHIMSDRAHIKASGKYEINGDTIILYSSINNTIFNVNQKWLIISKDKISQSTDLKQKKNKCSVLEKDNNLTYIPLKESDFALTIDSIKVNKLNWIKDTTNYNSELESSIIIRGNRFKGYEPIVFIDDNPIEYNFLLNYYNLDEIESINISSIKGGANPNDNNKEIIYHYIYVKTKNGKPKR